MALCPIWPATVTSSSLLVGSVVEELPRWPPAMRVSSSSMDGDKEGKREGGLVLVDLAGGLRVSPSVSSSVGGDEEGRLEEGLGVPKNDERPDVVVPSSLSYLSSLEIPCDPSSFSPDDLRSIIVSSLSPLVRSTGQRAALLFRFSCSSISASSLTLFRQSLSGLQPCNGNKRRRTCRCVLPFSDMS